MISIREKYWRYSLFVLILGMGILLACTLRPLVGGLLGAATIYILLRRQMHGLTAVCGWRRTPAAALLTAEAVVCFLIPLSLIVWMLVVRIQDATAHSQELIAQIRHFAAVIRERTGFDLMEELDTQNIMGTLSRIGRWLLLHLINLALNGVALLFVLYFMLIGGYDMEEYCREILPFDRRTANSVLREIHTIVRSNAIVIPLLALCQGMVAYVGYLLFGAPLPLFWAVVTCFASVLPVAGTALVWLPLSAWMMLDGTWGTGIGLALYGVLIITHVDNVMRLILQRRMADTHPLIIIFGVVVGLPLFGFIGVIFGPLTVALFVYFVALFKRTYLDVRTKKTP